MAKILITGGGGMLAQAVAGTFALKHSVQSLASRELDITDPAAARAAIERFRPHVLVNCAAFTKVDGCESEEDRATRTNGIAVGYLAAALPASSLFVQISTDFVFDGRLGRPYREDDRADPISAYGRSKLLGERSTQARRGPWLLVRTAWLFGAGGKNFVDTIREKAARGETLEVVDDQRGNPTWTVDLAVAILFLVERGQTGIYHAAGSTDTTWYEFAREIVRRSGHTVAVEAISSRDLDRPAVRPADSRLDCGKLARLGPTLMSWQEALASYLDRERCAWEAPSDLAAEDPPIGPT